MNNKAASPVRCETCNREWDLDDLEQVQPDGRYVCPLWTGDPSVNDADEHIIEWLS